MNNLLRHFIICFNEWTIKRIILQSCLIGFKFISIKLFGKMDKPTQDSLGEREVSMLQVMTVWPGFELLYPGLQVREICPPTCTLCRFTCPLAMTGV